ncbi:MAG: DHH family phosphoesterase [Candidatus Wildermuthbacteria bacterium]|nr:DHH family phosphoesterase [Candidatus Wildermuthbacteria bacterium]
MQIKNLLKAAKRIQKAVKAKECIILYGDADMDGVSSVLILQEAIKNAGGSVARVYFPDRESNGYGINEHALKELKHLAPALLIVMDLGITNFKEVKLAKAMGFEVIIIDHHEIIEKLPEADIIVNPKQKGDRYPFKLFAACGLTFRLAEALLGEKGSPSVKKSILELAMLGTVADMMPREEDNLQIIEDGLAQIGSSWRPGIRAFFKTKALAKRESMGDKVSYIISVLNVRDIENELPGAYRLLTMSSLEEAEALLSILEGKNQERHRIIDEIVSTVERETSKNPESELMFYGDSSFDYVLLGGAASILAKEHRKPVFLHKKKGAECVGSVRAPHGYDTVKAMEHCSKLLITFGGHPPASGFRIKTKNLKKFEECLSGYFKKHHA